MIFVDTGMWYAALDRSDASHDRAVAVLGAGEPLLTSDHVLVESWRLVAHRLGHHIAERFFDSLRRGRAALEPVLAVDREAAWATGRRFDDQMFSLVDRTSFAVMERLGIERVATFDRDFAVYRFGAGGRRAFEILR